MSDVFDNTSCKHCRGRVEFRIELAGQVTVCPHCRITFTLPTKEEIVWKAQLTIATINDAERFDAMQRVLPVALGWSCFAAIVFTLFSAACINTGVLLLPQTRLGFILWPWLAVMVVAQQFYILFQKSKRRLPSTVFLISTTLGLVCIWLFWAYTLLVAGIWRIVYQEELGFYPTWTKCLFVLGGVLGFAACFQISRSTRWLSSHIKNYEQLSEAGMQLNIE